jgi:hypothetical protein
MSGCSFVLRPGDREYFGWTTLKNPHPAQGFKAGAAMQPIRERQWGKPKWSSDAKNRFGSPSSSVMHIRPKCDHVCSSCVHLDDDPAIRGVLHTHLSA